jgi:hypothetical protein
MMIGEIGWKDVMAENKHLLLSCLVYCVSILMKCEEHQLSVRRADLQGREEFTVDQGRLPESHPRCHVTGHSKVRILSMRYREGRCVLCCVVS